MAASVAPDKIVRFGLIDKIVVPTMELGSVIKSNAVDQLPSEWDAVGRVGMVGGKSETGEVDDAGIWTGSCGG